MKRLLLVQALPILLICMFFSQTSTAFATSVDRLSLCNLEGYPGETIITQITLTGDEAGIRTGYWDKYYKKGEGDNEMMDITSWMTFEPKQFSIYQGETKSFDVSVKIPDNAYPGLWGAVSKDAGLSGQSSFRRTYLSFRDSLEGGNVYSGMLIPVSVQVSGTPNPLTPFFNFITNNLIVITMGAIIVVLASLLISRIRPKKVAKI